jgi:hypothetical protein
MRLSVVLLVFTIFINDIVAQSEQYYFNYQAAIRNKTGNVITNEEIELQISIVKDDIDNVPEFVERHNTITNGFGLINIKIGSGDVQSGSFDALPWGSGLFFLKLEILHQGDYETIGFSQLASIPLAMHAKTASKVSNITYDEIQNRPTKLSELNNDLSISEFKISNDSLIINFNNKDYYVDLKPYKPQASDTANFIENGLFTAREKLKLSNIEENANNYNIIGDLIDTNNSEAKDKAATARQVKLLADRLKTLEAASGDADLDVYYGSLVAPSPDAAFIKTNFAKRLSSNSQFSPLTLNISANSFGSYIIPANWKKPQFFLVDALNHVLMDVFYKEKELLIDGVLYSVWITDVKFPASQIKLKL